jgi:hypothetical protein
VVNRKFYLEYMHDMSQAKVKEGLSNLQANVKLGLECPFTQTEDCAAALYCELVDTPYIARVRGGHPVTGKAENLLDLGPYHQQKLDFCKKIAEDPLLALGQGSADGVTGLPLTFEGKNVARPEVIYAVLRAAVHLPHLPVMIAAFFRGAHAKLIEFVKEFEAGGDIAGLSLEERAAAFLSTTNDVNEGALGMLRVALRKSPNLSLVAYNARMMLRKNRVASFMCTMSKAQWEFCRQEARKRSSGSVERLRRVQLAQSRVDRARQYEIERKEKARKAAIRKAASDVRMATLEVQLDEARIAKLTGVEVKLQLEWHKLRAIKIPGTKKNIVSGTSKLKVHELRTFLCDLVKRFPPAPEAPDTLVSV